MCCVYRPDPGLCFCCITDQANRWSPCVVVLGCQWIQVDDATPRSWPLKLAAVWRLSWSFRQSFCHLPEPSTWRSVHHMPSSSYGDSEHGRRSEDISCARTVPGRNHHSVCASPCVGRGTGSCTEEPSCRPLAGRRHVVDMPVLRAGRYGDRCHRFHQAGMIDRRLLAATCNSPHSAVMIRSSNNA